MTLRNLPTELRGQDERAYLLQACLAMLLVVLCLIPVAIVVYSGSAGRLESLLRWLLALTVLGVGATLFSGYRLLATLREEPDPHHGGIPDRFADEQQAIIRLLDEMAPLADGHLDVRATVNEAMTGALADAFNQAVGELRRLVRAIQSSSRDVNSAVISSRQRMHEMALGGTRQAREIQRSATYLNALSHAMAQLTADGESSAAAARRSLQRVVEARSAVQANREKLARVGEQASNTMAAMQRLGESAGSIQGAVAEIRRVSRRTELLSLNARLHTAAVGADMDSRSLEAEERLGSLADDVSDLATTLGRVSREIDSLAGVILYQADETVQALNETRAEITAAEDHADTVSDALLSVDALSHSLQDLMGSIAEQTRRQSAVVQRLAGNMRVINDLGHQHAGSLQDAATELDRQQELAARLNASVQGFHLPKRDSDAVAEPFDDTARMDTESS